MHVLEGLQRLVNLRDEPFPLALMTCFAHLPRDTKHTGSGSKRQRGKGRTANYRKEFRQSNLSLMSIQHTHL